MSYHQFILAYQSGTFGCSVRTRQAVKLFISGKPDPGIARAALARWLFELVFAIATSVGLFVIMPPLLGLLVTIMGLFVISLIFVHQVADLLLDCCLKDDQFFETAIKDNALIVLADDDLNVPFVQGVVAMPLPARKKASGGS